MGVVIDLCVCPPQQINMPNSKLNGESEDVNLHNLNNMERNEADNVNNNFGQVKKRKKISNGITINEATNDAETFNNLSLNGGAISTPKNKKETTYSQKSRKRDKERKNSKLNSANNNDEVKSKKSQEKKNDNDEELENINISETVVSEIIINDKIKTIPKEKKKKIKGKNNINVVVIGYNEVGKSSFCIRLVENRFEDFYIPSICNENFFKMSLFNERNYKINFTVILGGPKIEKQENILSTADFFLLIYDITKIRSFNQINIYLKQIKKYLFFYDKEGEFPNFFLLGNKSDLEEERKVSSQIVNKCIEKYKIKHFDISIKNTKNISSIIQELTQIFDKFCFSTK